MNVESDLQKIIDDTFIELRRKGLIIEDVTVNIRDLPPFYDFVIEVPRLLEDDLFYPPDPSQDLFLNSTYIRKGYYRSYYVGINMKIKDQPFHIHLNGKFDGGILCYLTIMANSTMAIAELFDSKFLFDSDTIGFQYNLNQNTDAKERLIDMVQKGVPVESIPDERKRFLRSSSVIWDKTLDGYNVHVRLYLQEPNPNEHIQFYAIRPYLINRENDPAKSPNAVVITDGKYPLIPVKLHNVFKFGMVVDYEGENPQVVHDLGLPLSIDGTNQWYAAKKLKKWDKVEIFYDPKRVANNVSIVYRATSLRLITANQIYEGIDSMVSFIDRLR